MKRDLARGSLARCARLAHARAVFAHRCARALGALDVGVGAVSPVALLSCEEHTCMSYEEEDTCR
jgi:hypothetical protein